MRAMLSRRPPSDSRRNRSCARYCSSPLARIPTAVSSSTATVQAPAEPSPDGQPGAPRRDALLDRHRGSSGVSTLSSETSRSKNSSTVQSRTTRSRADQRRQLHHVDRLPHEPGREPEQLEPGEIRDRGVPGQGHHLAEQLEVERLPLPAGQAGLELAGEGPPLAQCHLGGGHVGAVAVAVDLGRVVAERVHAGRALHLEEAVHDQASVTRLGQGERGHHRAHLGARRPDHAARRDEAAVLQREPLGGDRGGPGRLELDAALDQPLLRVGGQVGRGLGQHLAADQHEPDRLGRDARVVAHQDAAGQLLHRRHQLRARVPRAHHHERQQATADPRVVGERGGLEELDHPVADAKGVAHALERERVLGRARGDGHVGGGAERQHQAVVVHLLAQRRAMVPDRHPPPLEVDPLDLHLAELDAPAPAERADRVEDVARLDRPGGGLRQHRGEQEEVLVAQQRDVHGQEPRAPLRELERGGDAREAAAQDDDARAPATWTGGPARGRPPGLRRAICLGSVRTPPRSASSHPRGEQAPGAQRLGDAPGLRDAAARRERRLGVEDLGDGADAVLAEVLRHRLEERARGRPGRRAPDRRRARRARAARPTRCPGGRRRRARAGRPRTAAGSPARRARGSAGHTR